MILRLDTKTIPVYANGQLSCIVHIYIKINIQEPRENIISRESRVLEAIN